MRGKTCKLLADFVSFSDKRMYVLRMVSVYGNSAKELRLSVKAEASEDAQSIEVQEVKAAGSSLGYFR